LFVGAGTLDFHLQQASPAINTIPTGSSNPVLTDLEGTVRPQSDGYDMGCYEFTQAAPTQYTLTVNTSGSGSVTLSPSGGTYDANTDVTLTAVPITGWAFIGWSGDLSGSTNPTTITMDAAKTVTATFQQIPPTQYTLTVIIAGEGSVNSSPPGSTFDAGTQVALTPVADEGWVFSSWIGDLTGSAVPGNITMDADQTVTATFVEKTSPEPPTVVGEVDEINYDVADTIILNTSPYYDPDMDEHKKTHWQIWRADNNEMVFDEISSFELTQYTILPDSLIKGIKYIWRVGYEDEDTNISWSIEYAFKIGTSEADDSIQVTTGTDVADYKMVSFVQYPDDPRAEIVFGDELGADYDGNYRIGTYNANRNAYDEYGTGRLMVEPGRGYWFLAREGLDTIVDGVFVSLSTDIYIALDYNPDTQNGWNMVGPPNGADYLWGNVEVVVDDGQALTAVGTVQSLADDNPYLDRRLWRWESGAYASDTPDTDPTQVMAAYEGYWVKTRQAGVFLRFDPGVQIASIGGSDTLLGRTWHKASTLLSKLNIFSQEAMADNDMPPMPMGGLDDNTVEPVFQGCFVEAISDKQ